MEKGTKELLENAIILYKTPETSSRSDADEKMWDALERLKTYYTELDKKKSIEIIFTDMAAGKPEYMAEFNEEFTALKLGNNFRSDVPFYNKYWYCCRRL